MLRRDSSKQHRYAFLLATLFACVFTLRVSGDEPNRSGGLLATEPFPHQEVTTPQDADAISSERATGSAEETASVFSGGENSCERDVHFDGTDYFQSDFDHGEAFVIRRGDASLRIGGYVKADLIYDFNAILSTDGFNPTTIPTDGRRGTNTRLHARQTRLNLDFRPDHDRDDRQLFIEGDFFGEGNSLRLRHAFLRTGRLLAGQTWSTFMDETILPGTLDFESPRSILLSRRALIRLTRPVTDRLSVAVALEDPQPALDLAIAPGGGDVERLAPSLISRFRYETPRWHLQGAGLVQQIGFREASGARDEATGWGFNFTGSYSLRDNDRALFQVAFGEGYESYRQGIDGAVDANGVIDLNPVLAWVVGYEVDWTKRLSSTFVFSVAEGTTAPFQPGNRAERIDYLALNLVRQHSPSLRYGIEYLYGSRTEKDFSQGLANRLMFSIRYDLP